MNLEKLWSVDDLAEYCGVTKRTVYDWNYKGTGPRSIPVGNHVRYRPSDVVKWINDLAAKAA